MSATVRDAALVPVGIALAGAGMYLCSVGMSLEGNPRGLLPFVGGFALLFGGARIVITRLGRLGLLD